MKKFSLLLVLAPFAVSLTGCAPAQFGETRITDEQVIFNVAQQDTTKKQVYIYLGQPHDVDTLANGDTLWHYYLLADKIHPLTYVPYLGLLAGGSTMTLTERIVQFEDNKVINIQKKCYKDYQNMWTHLSSMPDSLPKYDRVEKEMSDLKLPFDKERVKRFWNVDEIIKDSNIVDCQ